MASLFDNAYGNLPYALRVLNPKSDYNQYILTQELLAEDIDYFDTLVEQWKKAGGEQVTADINEMYGNK